MIELGAQLTVSARTFYPFREQPGHLGHLVGFNEMQHQVFGRIRHLRRGEDWTLETLLEALSERAEQHGIGNELGSALRISIAKFR